MKRVDQGRSHHYGGGSIVPHHGHHVELFENDFFEGAWGGDGLGSTDRPTPLAQVQEFDRSAIVFVPPSHAYELPESFTENGQSSVPNSLAFPQR